MTPASESRFDPNFAAQILLDIAHEQSLETLLRKLVERVMEKPHMGCAQVWLIEKGDRCHTCRRRSECPDQSHCLHLAVAKGKSILAPGKGFGQFDPQTSREPLGAPPIGSVVVSGQQRAVADLNGQPVSRLDPNWMREEGIRGYAINPISYKGEALGAIVTATRERFQEELLPWGRLLANQVGAAIANARAFEEIRLAGKRLEEANQRLAQELAERKKTEDKLRKQADLLDLTHDAVFVVGMDGLIKYWNRGAKERYGWTAEQVIGKVAHDLLKTVFPAPLEQIRAEVLRAGRWEGEVVQTKKDGTQAMVASRWALQRSEKGAPVAILETNSDITERKRAEEALRESERKYHELVEHANSIILHWRRNGQIIHLNEFGQRFFGYTETELRGRQIIGTLVPETESRGRDLQKLLEEIGANPSAFEQNVNENMRCSGERVWIAWTNKAVLNSKGEVTEILSIGVDITSRKRAEEALRRSEAYLAEGQRLSHTGSWAWNPITLQALYWSEEMFRIFDFDPRQGVPAPEVFRERIHPEDRDQTYGFLLNAAQRGSEYEHEHRIVLPDGSVKYIQAIGHPVFDEAGKLVEYVGTAIDVTERKLAEDELRRHRENLEDMVRHRTEQLAEAKARAEAANREKSRFLANMSHELRTPLHAVLGFSRLLKGGTDVTPRQQEALDLIVRSGEHLLTLINNVLDMAKIESGRVVLEESEVDLHQLLHEIQSLMGVGASEKGLEFALERAPDLPRFVAVDAGKLRQVLLNLVGNAIKYTGSGGVKLRARPAGSDAPESAQVRFEVEDSGPGIGQEDRQRIFSPFVQLGSQASPHAGTGLGLAICKQYVELMGGQIGVASEPGKGSVFYFTISVSVLPSMEAPVEPKHGRVVGLAEGQPCYRLLIVEDQAENRLLLRRILEPLGVELREAVNGQEAVALFKQWQPHLIWMDIRMPVMDGLDAIRRIRASNGGTSTRIIALTAHALEEESSPIMAAGCDDLVRKPFREQEIFDALSRHLQARFVYDKDPHPERTAEPSQLTLRPEQLRTLPREWLQDLHQAVVELDTARTHALIERVAARDASLGRALNTLAARFDYASLLDLLEHSQTGETL